MVRGADGVWRLMQNRSTVDVPGNSGQPEFKFVVDDSRWIDAKTQPAGYRFADNFVILFPGDDPRDVAGRDAEAQIVKESYENSHEMANFRELGGGTELAAKRLYRSYHPFIESRPELKIEPERLKAVQRLMTEARIAAVINLSDSEHEVKDEEVPASYRKLVDEGNVLLATTSYEDSYYHPGGPRYGEALKRVFNFIAAHPGPYLIHCRLGTDRTGVLSAVLEAFAGVPWPVIEADYLKSNKLGIREYRHSRLLAYSFKQMLGQWPYQIADLQGEMHDFLLRQDIGKEVLEAAAHNLQ
jgi:hypothetical protein